MGLEGACPLVLTENKENWNHMDLNIPVASGHTDWMSI